MRVAMLLACALVAAASGCGGTSPARTTTSTRAATPPVPWPDSTPQVVFGVIRSFTPLAQGYKLRLDLQLRFGPDKTGLAACIDNRDCPPGQTGFPDDTYDRDLKYVVTYYVPAATPVDLVTFAGGVASVRVTARYFYGLSQGRNPRHLKGITVGGDALHAFAFWVELAPVLNLPKSFDPVLRLYQQFHP